MIPELAKLTVFWVIGLMTFFITLLVKQNKVFDVVSFGLINTMLILSTLVCVTVFIYMIISTWKTTLVK